MDEFQAGNVRGALQRELAAALAAHLPPRHVEDAKWDLWDFANKQLSAWREKTTHVTNKKEGSGGNEAGSTLVQCARVLSGSAPPSPQLQSLTHMATYLFACSCCGVAEGNR